MVEAVRREQDFPALANQAYLNTAAEGIPSPPVFDAIAEYGRDKSLGMDGRPLHHARWLAVREKAASFYGLSPAETAICSCTSEAYNLLAQALALGEADRVVINDLDFPAATTPWLRREQAAAVDVWRSRDGALRVEDLIPLLGAQTRLVAVSLVSFLNGFKVDLPALLSAVRAHSSALVAVDCTQALGRIPLEVADADFVVSSTHKWILGPHGGALIGVPERQADRLTVPAAGWFSIDDAFRASRFDTPAVSKPGAHSYMQGHPNYAVVYGVDAALGYIAEIGVERIAAQADPLVRELLAGLRSFPVQILTPTEAGSTAGIVAFTHPKADHILAFLHRQGVHIMGSAGRLRVSLHGYNTVADLETFFRVLRAALNAV